MIKYFLLFAAIVGGYQALNTKHCTRQSTCGKDECCLGLAFQEVGICKKRVKEGKKCTLLKLLRFPNPELYYEYICPCEIHLKCEKEKEKKLSFFRKCVPDTEPDTTEESKNSKETEEPEVPIVPEDVEDEFK